MTIADFRAQGLTVRRGTGNQLGMLLASPAPTPEQAALIRGHKPALLAELEEEAKAAAHDLRAGEGPSVLVPGTDGDWYAFSPEGWATWVLWAALGGSSVRKPKWSAKKRRVNRDGLLWK